jgi:hypothetical protein
MVSKYGASRELIHFQDILETQLPLITDFKHHDELEKDVNFGHKKFTTIIGKFLKNKAKSKLFYKKGISTPYLLHELVMRKIHNPPSAFHPTYAGPVRIIELHPQGALIKDTRTGEMMSVHYMNLRKLTADEFLTLLPNNFDSDILNNLGMYRYNKNHLPDPMEKPLLFSEDDFMQELDSLPDVEKLTEIDSQLDNKPDIIMTDHNERILRSGKRIRVNTFTLPSKYKENAIYSFWSYTYKNKENKASTSCLTRKRTVKRTPYAVMDQYFQDECYFFHSNTQRIPRPDDYHKTKYKSSFSSSLPGYLTIQLGEITDMKKDRKIKFEKIIVKFY